MSDFGIPLGVLPYDAYLHVDAHPGECSDSKHVDWMEIKQFRHDIDQKVAASFAGSGAPTAGQASHGYFWVCKEQDKATPKLLLSSLNGTAISEIKLDLCTQVGEKEPFMQVVLKNAIVASVHTVATPVSNADGEALTISKPVEWVGFAYGEIEWNYTERDHATGATKGQIIAHWNRVDNTGG